MDRKVVKRNVVHEGKNGYACYCKCGCGWCEKSSIRRDVVAAVAQWYERNGLLYCTEMHAKD